MSEIKGKKKAYGGITNCFRYLNENYEGKPTLMKRVKQMRLSLKLILHKAIYH